MKVAGNKLVHLSDYYFSELQTLYPESEIQALFEHCIHHYLHIPIREVKRRKEERINQSELLLIYDCCKALKQHIPLQYILGTTFFYELEFEVNKHVLIPRPETEELVDLIVKDIQFSQSLLDIGTGSGCIPVSIKHKLKPLLVSACDISHEALSVAQKNAEKHKTNIHFFEADALNTKEFNSRCKNSFDVIVSNPPYIKLSEKQTMSANVSEHEPHLALFVDNEDAVIFYKKIVDICITKLNQKGKLYFELNPLTANEVLEYTKASGVFETSTLLNDMSGNTRFLKALKF
jgi:release factor glutamine methyltransferase